MVIVCLSTAKTSGSALLMCPEATHPIFCHPDQSRIFAWSRAPLLPFSPLSVLSSSVLLRFCRAGPVGQSVNVGHLGLRLKLRDACDSYAGHVVQSVPSSDASQLSDLMTVVLKASMSQQMSLSC